MQKIVGIAAGLIAVIIACTTMWLLVRFDRGGTSAHTRSLASKLTEIIVVAAIGLVCGFNAPQSEALIAFLPPVFISLGLSGIYRFKRREVKLYQRSILVLWVLWGVGVWFGFQGNANTGTLIAIFLMWALSALVGRQVISLGNSAAR